IVGGEHFSEPDYPEMLATQARQGRLGSRIHFAGHQTDAALWMQAMDVVVHASTGAEPFGMVLIEAMALGKTVIASRAGGPLEIMTDGVDGVLVEPGDPAALAAALDAVLAAGVPDPCLSRAARQKAVAFGAQRLAADVADRLRDIVDEAGG